MPSRTVVGLDEALQRIIESAERSDWDQLDQIAAKLLPALTAICEAPPPIAADEPKVTALLLRLHTAIERCKVRQAQISPLLEALSKKTPELP